MFKDPPMWEMPAPFLFRILRRKGTKSRIALDPEVQYKGPLAYAPANLSLEAHAIRLSKMNNSNLQIPEWKMNFVFDCFMQTMSSFNCPAITGYTHEEAIAVLDRSKSPGMPWTVLGYLNKGMVIDNNYEKLREFYEQCEDFNVLWSLSNKDELRPLEKVESKSTRVFQIASIEHTYVAYRVFGHLCDSFYRWHSEFNAVGVSPYRGEWHDLMLPFLRFDGHLFDTDGIAYDLNISAQWMHFAKQVLLAFVHPDQISKVEWLFHTAIYSYCVAMDGSVFQKCKSNPSGWLLTIIVNTLIMYALLMYAWFELFGYGPRQFDDFRCETRQKIVGDDNVSGVTQRFAPYYNPTNIVDVLSPVQPFESDYQFKTLQQVSLCQAVTIKHGKYLVPYYPSERCFSSLAWLRTRDLNPAHKLGKFVSLLEGYWFREDFRKVVLVEIRRHVAKYGALWHSNKAWRKHFARSSMDLSYSYSKGSFKDYALLKETDDDECLDQTD